MKPRSFAWIVSGLMAAGSVFPAVAQASDPALTQLFPALAGVSLTSAQQSQLESLSAQTLPQVQRLLTPTQQAQFDQALGQGQGVRAAAVSLNLSGSQRLQILALLQAARSQVASILTPTQQRQIQDNARR
jgi:Spy/CpxP family protein refolding chaperone